MHLKVGLSSEMSGSRGRVSSTMRRKKTDVTAIVRENDALRCKIAGLEAAATERIESALQESEFFFKESQRAASIGSYKADFVVGRWTSSEVLDQIFGIATDYERTVAGWLDLVYPDDKEMMDRYLREEVIGKGRPFCKEYRIVRQSDGQVRWVLGLGEVASDADGQILSMMGTIQDITERKQLEIEREKLQDDLFQAQKMEAIGTLAGGVAHDFNNILSGVLGGLSLLEQALGNQAEHLAEIQDMKALVQRGASLAKQLLGFARRGKYQVEALDLAQVVERTATMFGQTRRDLLVQLKMAPDLLRVVMDHTQLEQVLLNLLLNAAQAMPGGGQIVLRAENVALSPGQAEPHGTAPGRFVKLVVTDTGIGMDAATQARIFEPFFTTKSTAGGNGLGLASVYGIIKIHGGIKSVASEPGKGTSFTLLLPATEAAATERAPAAAPPVAGKGAVLVVDDEMAVRNVCARMLQRMGYEVLTAPGGEEAVELVRVHKDRLTLVILDLTMPGMSGAKTYEALRAVAPSLKVLLSSGYSVEGYAQKLLERGCVGFLEKPFDTAALSAKLRELL
jgi:two-component system cell cycle sensor histidine kinase/response regulator CckA